MIKLGTGKIGRVGALAFAFASLSAIASCGDNGVTPPPDAPDIDAPPPKPAVLTMTPAMNDFGSIIVGNTSAAASFTVTNTGEATSGMIAPIVTGTNASDFTPTTNCSTLAGAGTCVVTVTFHPAAAGTKSASLVVSGSPGGTVMAALLGTGTSVSQLQIAPPSLAFNSVLVGATGTQQTFTITNGGGVATSTMTTTKAGSDPADFTKVSDTCNGMTLGPTLTCTIVVNFAPTSAGPKAASFIVSATTGGSVNGSVSGTGVAPANLQVNPSLQDFGTIPVGSSSANVTFTVTNVGGASSSAISRAITGDYTIVNDNCAGTVLAPNTSCNVIVRFSPTAVGPRNGTLDITAATGATPARTAVLNGAGVQVGNLTISDNPFPFPATTTNTSSTSHVFTVTNTGGAPSGAIGTALGGTDPSQFQIVAGSNGCQGTILAAAGTCTIAVIFHPTTGGGKSANLSVSATPGGTAQANITGLGLAPAQFDINPQSQDYGSVVTTTQSAIVKFTVTNLGGQDSGAVTAVLNGTNASEFTITSTTCAAALTPSPAAGSACDVFVQFRPVTTGPKAASLTINGTPGGPINAALSGNGISNASIAVNPTILTFPLINVGDVDPTPQSFTVTNQGSVNTGDMTISVAGMNPTDFDQVNNCEDGAGPGVDFLIPGGTCVVTVTFHPIAPYLADQRRDRHATLLITASPGAPAPGGVTVALNGTSQPRYEILQPIPVTDPNNYDFGSDIIDTNAPKNVPVQVRNNTNATVTLVNVETGDTGSFDDNGGAAPAGCAPGAAGGSVGTGANCTFVVLFDPLLVGANAATYTLTGTTGATPCPIVTGRAVGWCNLAVQNVTGVGTINTIHISDVFAGQPDINGGPTAHDFGDHAVGTSSATRIFRVFNDSNSASGTIAVDLATNPAGAFQITSNSCSGTQIAGVGSCDIGIVFTPNALNGATGMITVRTSTGTPTLGGTVTATVAGNGTAPAPLTTGTAIDFGTLFAGETSLALTRKTFVIHNPNDVPTTVTGGITGSPTNWSLVPTAVNDCGIVGGFINGNIPAGGQCTVTVAWTQITLAEIGTRPQASVNIVLGTGNLKAAVTVDGAGKSTLSYTMLPAPFTNQVINTTASHTVKVHNDTDAGGTAQTLNNFNVVAASGNPMFILNNTCATLAAGAECQFDVEYAPVAAPANNSTSLFVVAFKVGGGNPATGFATTTIIANAITAANVVVTPTLPTPYDFGTELVGQTSAQTTFTYTNLGQQTSGVVAVSLSLGSPNYTIPVGGNTCGATLAGGASCTVTVGFTPTVAGTIAGTLASTASPGGNTTRSLTGVGLALGAVRVTPGAFTFADTTAGQVSTPLKKFTLQNTDGANPTTINPTPSAEFEIVVTGAVGECPAGSSSLGFGASCDVFVRFHPLTAGQKTGSLTVNGAGSLAVLYGNGLTVAAVVSNIGGVFTNATALSMNVSLAAPSPIVIAGITGSATSIRIHLNGYTTNCSAGSEFVLQAPNGQRLRFMAGTGNSVLCNAVFGAIDLVFDDGALNALQTGPTANAPSAGTFRPTDGNNFPNLIPGSAAAPEGTATIANTLLGAPVSGTWTLFAGDRFFGTTVTGGWSLEINNLDFGTQAIATTSPSRTVTLTNTGETASTAITGTVGGLDFNQYVITDGCNGATLAPVNTAGSTCNLVVAFKPTTTGVKNASVAYTGGAVFNVPMTGNAVNPPSLGITPTVPQTDPDRPVGKLDGASTSFTISNPVGAGTTGPITYSLSNTADFAFDAANSSCDLGNGGILLAGGSCTVAVFFNPTHVMAGLTTTVKADAGTSGGMVTNTLTANGTEALVRTAPGTATVVFTDDQACNTPACGGTGANPGTGSTQTITLQNVSDNSTSLIGTVLTNSAGSDFSMVSDGCGGLSLAAGGTCNVTVRFVPSGTPGARTGLVTFTTTVVGATTTATAPLASNVLP